MRYQSVRPLVTACLLTLCGAAAAQQPKAAQGPSLRPAAQARNADKARILASARAGDRIVAVGDHGIVLLSDDGGKTHRQARHVPVDFALTGVSFADAQRGWAVGHGGVILSTTDGGEAWAVQRSDTSTDRPLFAVHFFDAQNGVAVGLWSLVLRTTDSGVHWQPVDMPMPPGAKKADLNLLGLFADAKGRVFAAAEKGMVLRSDDRGLHWSYSSTAYKGSFWSGLATSSGTLLVAGLRGSLYRSTDDGLNWARIDTQSKSSITAMAHAGPHIIAVGMDGLVLRSGDDGATFKPEIRTDHASLTSVAIGANGQPVMYQVQGLVSADPVASR